MNSAIKIPNAFYRTSIKALVLDDKKRFLLTKDEKSGLWDLPGGGLDHGENPHDCIVREIREEMGIEVLWIAQNPSYFLSVITHPPHSQWITNIIYVTTLKHLNFTPSEECIEIGFFSNQQAKEQLLYGNVLKFTELFNPKNHQFTKP